MAVWFWIFLDQICPKWIKLDQTWSNWISHQSKNVTIKSCHIYKKDNNGCFILDFFGSDLSKVDQSWSNLIKLDQTWSNWISHQSKTVTIKSCHIYKKDNNGCFILDFFGSDLSKVDQTWSNLIKLDFSLIKKCYYKKLSHLQKG
jgi:hypothetical protein